MYKRQKLSASVTNWKREHQLRVKPGMVRNEIVLASSLTQLKSSKPYSTEEFITMWEGVYLNLWMIFTTLRKLNNNLSYYFISQLKPDMEENMDLSTDDIERGSLVKEGNRQGAIK